MIQAANFCTLWNYVCKSSLFDEHLTACFLLDYRQAPPIWVKSKKQVKKKKKPIFCDSYMDFAK